MLVNCQTTVAYRAIRSLHFPHMWVRHTERNVGPSYLGFPFPIGPPPSYGSLHGHSYLTFPSLAGPPHSELHYSASHVGPPHCEKCGLSHLRFPFPVGPPPSSCQQWDLTFLSTVAFRATKIPTTLRVDVLAAIRATKNLEDIMLPINYWN